MHGLLLHERFRCIGKCCEDTGVGVFPPLKNGNGRSWSTAVSLLGVGGTGWPWRPERYGHEIPVTTGLHQ